MRRIVEKLLGDEGETKGAHGQHDGEKQGQDDRILERHGASVFPIERRGASGDPTLVTQLPVQGGPRRTYTATPRPDCTQTVPELAFILTWRPVHSVNTLQDASAKCLPHELCKRLFEDLFFPHLEITAEVSAALGCISASTYEEFEAFKFLWNCAEPSLGIQRDRTDIASLIRKGRRW